MSQTIMMPSSFDQAVKEMCATAVSQAVAALAEKYGFDQEEALRELNVGDLKIVRKRGPSPKKETGAKKAKAADGSPKAKRAKTGYLLYADDVRSAVQAELTSKLEEGAKLKPQDTVKGIAARWKAEDPEIRTMWAARAKGEHEPAPVAAASADVEMEEEEEEAAEDDE
jgi:hypothetical protein